jgi:carbonic anhydrase/acetyltransferase-like protein (isoleucine patch superfamily)
MKYSIGFFISELGGGMDRFGSRLSEDISYTQTLSRHRSIMALDEVKPSVDYSFVASNATLTGEVNVSAYASIWFNSTLRAEYSPIRVGSYSSIGDGSTISTHCAVPTGVPASVTIGKHVTIQNNCTIFSSIIDDEVFIGANSIIGEGCKIEKGAVIAPNSLVPPGKLIPGRQLWGGNPAKFIRDLTDEEAYSYYIDTFNTWNLAQNHLNGFGIEKKNDEIEINPDSLVANYLSENYFKWRAKYSNY